MKLSAYHRIWPRSSRTAIFVAILMACLTASLSAAAAPPEVKTRQFDGLTLEYRLQIENNPRVAHDGQAFVRTEAGKRIYTVLLNRAYFEREGGEIFDRLSKGSESRRESPEAGEGIAALEADWFSPGHIPVAELRALQIQLENAAWRELHERCVAAHASARKARRDFVRAFARARLASIEEHEVSHLIDLARGGDEASPDFARETELKAFYAELARGGNPLDSMSQALAGLLDEVRRGRTVDYSREKVAAVLRFLRASPNLRRRIPELLRADGPPSGSAEVLAIAGNRLLAENPPQ